MKEDSTFFSNVISASYYCIFYSAKAFLLTNEIKTEMPDEHRKTLEEFEKLANSGVIDGELLKIYTITGKKKSWLLFIIPVNSEVIQKINTETGEILQTKKPWWSFLDLGV